MKVLISWIISFLVNLHLSNRSIVENPELQYRFMLENLLQKQTIFWYNSWQKNIRPFILVWYEWFCLKTIHFGQPWVKYPRKVKGVEMKKNYQHFAFLISIRCIRWSCSCWNDQVVFDAAYAPFEFKDSNQTYKGIDVILVGVAGNRWGFNKFPGFDAAISSSS